jgi:hypothetical protein
MREKARRKNQGADLKQGIWLRRLAPVSRFKRGDFGPLEAKLGVKTKRHGLNSADYNIPCLYTSEILKTVGQNKSVSPSILGGICFI